jgi:hypothetical protein
MSIKSLFLAAVSVIFGLSSHVVLAADVATFHEDFETSLSQWVDRNPANPFGKIVVDPINSTNHVLSFTRLGSFGSIFSQDRIISADNVSMTFDYLGIPSAADAADLGGFFGISSKVNPDSSLNHRWIAGTGSFITPYHLVDDGAWHTYSLSFASSIGPAVHLMFEDFITSGPKAGDVYFDNIHINIPAVPEPASIYMFAAGLLSLLLLVIKQMNT